MESTEAPAAMNAYRIFEQVLDEATTALVSFQPVQVEGLEARYEMLASSPSFELSRSEAVQLTSRCRVLHYLLRYAAINFSVLDNLIPHRKTSSTRAIHRGYPWLR